MNRTTHVGRIHQALVVITFGMTTIACDTEEPPPTPEQQAVMDAADERLRDAWRAHKEALKKPSAHDEMIKKLVDLDNGQIGHGFLLKLDKSMITTSWFSIKLSLCCSDASLSTESETWVNGVAPDVTRAHAAVEQSWELEGGISGTPTAGEEERQTQHEKTVGLLIKARTNITVTLSELDERIPDESKSKPVRTLLEETRVALDDLKAVLAARVERLKNESNQATVAN